ncbi:MAG: hypothetical protein K6G12_06210 [Lachnospiraceae bacterium]|nr:hypothetical protein [Lachnospiraceae bacterium]
MHIAVCMDVAADRKQLERLLGRSADRRLAIDASIPYYVQSYGNKEALLARPFMYDLFFIDLLNDSLTSVELIRKLRSLGVVATIVLCPGKVDLSGELTEEDNVLILRQPIKVEELEEVIDKAVESSVEREPKLDIRGKDKTEHIKPDEFLYAEKTGDIVVDVHLKNGDVISCSENIENLKIRCEKFPEIFYLPKDLLAHKDYIMSTGFGKVILKDGRKFKVQNKWIKYMNAVLEAEENASDE